MKIKYFIWLFAGVAILSFSKEKQPFQPVTVIPFKAKQIVADHLGYYYLITRDKIQKVHFSDSLTQFHQRQNIGAITTVDVSNPMKKVVFYKDYRKIEILDTWMTFVREIDLDEYGYMQVNAACGSATNGIWIYDENSAQLKRINDAGELILQSVSTRQSMNKVLHVNYLVEKNGQVFVADPEVGIAVFDMFGSYIKTLPVRDVKKFLVMGDQIIYFQNGSIFNYNMLTLENKELALPDSSVSDAVLLKNKLVTISKDSVFVYSF